MNDFQTSDDKHPTFEETYPRYEFSELVRISLVIGGWIARRRRARVVAKPATVEPSHTNGPTAPAT